MTDPFHLHIRASLANPALQAALDGNAERRITVRQQAFDSLPDAPALRQRAHAVRADVIANLDRYLEGFILRLQVNGVIVHRAADADQALQIVLNIANQNQARLIAKSKTMISEEINLNQALEAAGLKVVETDLGEFIVQLRGEHPAHIITPAVHLRRQEVGQTFHEKLGLPLTDDIPTMTAAARRELRQVFLNADIGLSGVNFGVVETGTLCIVTNEGNGRMVTTLPPVHVALMGIERLVPTLADLALMLSLLPRSATGQKMSVYTSLIHGPRRPGDPDGPRERHLILLDNGRSVVRQSPLAEILYCIRCGACLNACPVFREIGGHAYVGKSGEGCTYPGPIGSVLSPALFGQSEFGGLARASSLCGACKEACPVDIDLPKLLLRVRAGKSAPAAPDTKAEGQEKPSQVPGYLKLGLGFFTWIATSPWRFSAAQVMAGFFSRILSPRSPWLHLPALTGWGYSKDFPRPASRPFRSQFNSKVPQESANLTPPSGQSEQSRVEAENPSQTAPPADTALGIERFTAELNALGGKVTACTTQELPGLIVQVLQDYNISTLLAWEEAHLPPGLLQALQKRGIQVSHSPDPAIRAGLTGALAAIAETGTLVLPGGAGRPLSASLLPEIHMAVLKGEDIYENLSQVIKLLEEGDKQENHPKPAVVLISGPSRTADIEMTLTIGVHGPKEVHVFCV